MTQWRAASGAVSLSDRAGESEARARNSATACTSSRQPSPVSAEIEKTRGEPPAPVVPSNSNSRKRARNASTCAWRSAAGSRSTLFKMGTISCPASPEGKVSHNLTSIFRNTNGVPEACTTNSVHINTRLHSIVLVHL